MRDRTIEQIHMMGRTTSNLYETLETMARGGGKTQGTSVCANVIATGEPGTPIMWLAGSTGQLEQADKYFQKYVPLFDGDWRNSKHTKKPQVYFPNGATIDFSPMTMVDGPRMFTIIKDEGGKTRDKQKLENYKYANGMMDGSWDYPIRLRHITTLAYDSAIEPVYYKLEPLGLVWRLPYWKLPWVFRKLNLKYAGNRLDIKSFVKARQPCPELETAVALAEGPAFLNTEYKCIMDVRGVGTHIFRNVRVLSFDQLPRWQLNKMWCLIGIDTNTGQGHACVVGLWHPNGKVYLVDEWNGLALRHPIAPDDPILYDRRSQTPLVDFLNKWRHKFPGKCVIICEVQGQSIANSLGELGIPVIPEPWTGTLQKARIPHTVDLCDRGLIYFLSGSNDTVDHVICGVPAGGVPISIEQSRKYYKDEKGNIPKQEDHNVDGIHHLVMGRPFVVPGQALPAKSPQQWT